MTCRSLSAAVGVGGGLHHRPLEASGVGDGQGPSCCSACAGEAVMKLE